MAGFVQEVMSDFNLWDREGYIWGRSGHWPLWVFLGPGRIKSDEGKWERWIAKQKVRQWKSSEVWPWWDYHESEKFYFLPGRPETGRGFSGSYWVLIIKGQPLPPLRNSDSSTALAETLEDHQPLPGVLEAVVLRRPPSSGHVWTLRRF